MRKSITAIAFVMLMLTGCEKSPHQNPQQEGDKTGHVATAKPARTATWETVSIPGYCTYQIPPTMEVQAGTYKRISDQFRKAVLEINQSQDRVVAQPKGVNEFDPMVLGKRYCRIIVETLRGTTGDCLKLDEPFAMSESELRELDGVFREQWQEAAAPMAARGLRQPSLLSGPSSSVIHLNGWSALLTTYRRMSSSGNKPPVVVRMYRVQNNDALHTITVSYRESGKELWADDLDAVITTFKFTKR